MDINGTSTTLLSSSNRTNDLAKALDWLQNDTKCDTNFDIKFILKASLITFKIHNHNIRCVVKPSTLLLNQEAMYSEQTIQVLDSK